MIQYFIGITPPKEIQEKVQEFQRQNRRNLFPKRVESHITLKAPGGLSADGLWFDVVKNAVKDFKSFEVSFGGIGYFGDRVLYLVANASELEELHKIIVKVLGTPKEVLVEFKEDKFHGHMTLGLRDKTFPDSDLLLAGEKAKRDLADLPSFKVEFIRVYRKMEGGLWEKMEDIPLAK